MANLTNDRYRYGGRLIVSWPVKASAVIATGDGVDLDSNGYAQPVGAGDIALGVAVQTITGTASDGGVSVLVDISRDSVYEYPPDTGTVAQASLGKTCDWGGAQSLDIDAATDNAVLIVGVNATDNTYFVQIKPTYAGVV